MNNIPPEFWMVIVSVLTGFVCFVLYQFGSVIKESKNTIVEAKKAVMNVNNVISDVSDVVNSAKGTVQEINESIVRPIKQISSIISVASGIIEGFTKK